MNRDWANARSEKRRADNSAIDHEISSRGFVCRDCGADVLCEFGYMLSDADWAATGLGPNDGLLCIGCLEDRLERCLAPEDFDRQIPINGHEWFDSPRLLARKLGIEEATAVEVRAWLREVDQ